MTLIQLFVSPLSLWRSSLPVAGGIKQHLKALEARHYGNNRMAQT